MKMAREFVAIFLVVILLMTCSTTVFAVSTDYDTVIDETGILTEYQIDSIEKEVSLLKQIRPVLYIENTLTQKCTDEYAYSLAKEKYNEIFGDATDGVIIVYCNAEEGFKFGVYFIGDWKIDSEEIKNSLIKESFDMYDTDSQWVTGSFITCVEYLSSLEEEIDKSSVTENKEYKPSFKDKVLQFFGKVYIIGGVIALIFVLAVLFVLNIFKKYYFNNERRE